ncbi:MAG: hypothetical protein WC600_09070 [Desulfobaccales bacterium]
MTPVTITIPSFTLNGWKTYVCAAALIGLSVARNLGYITTDLYDILLPIVGGGGLAALRSAVTKSGPQSILDGVSNLVTAAIQMQHPLQAPETKPPALGLAALAGAMPVTQGNVGGNG